MMDVVFTQQDSAPNTAEKSTHWLIVKDVKTSRQLCVTFAWPVTLNVCSIRYEEWDYPQSNRCSVSVG